jgi:hypothetical protein
VARNGAKWQLLLEARARGRTVKQAAQDSGYSLRQASRIVGDDDFQQQLRQVLEQQAEQDRAAFVEHRRAALGVAGRALVKLNQLLSSNVPPAVEERAARTVLDHARQLFPSPDALDLEDQIRQLEEAQAQLRGDRGGG